MLRWLEQTIQDLRYAVRVTAANPAFTLVAALSLALGIGANTAIYSFMDAILMRSLPVPDPGSLVVLNWQSKDFPPVAHSFSGSNFKEANTGMTSNTFPYTAFELFRGNHPPLSAIFGFTSAGRLNLLIKGQADLAFGQYVSGEFFRGLIVPPAAGRLIDESDDRAGGPMAVLGFAYAQRRFGSAAAAVGQPILINNVPFNVIGVAAPEFFGTNPGDHAEVFLPMHSAALLTRNPDGKPDRKYIDSNYFWMQMMARVRPGVSRQAAQSQLAGIFQSFMAGVAANDKERGDLPSLMLQDGAGGLDFLRRRYSQPLYVLMTMVALILAIACANVANLLLARAAARRREMAVRLSLGAGRLRVIRQLLTESLALACAGGLLGIVFAKWGIRFLTWLIANGQENFSLYAALNWNVLGMTLGLCIVTGLLFGLAPAIQATGIDLSPSLKQSRAGAAGGRGRTFLRISLSRVLVVAQIAISLLLLVAAGLFVRTLSNLQAIQLGFTSENVLLLSLNARQAGYSDEALGRFYASLQARMEAIPGVRAASLSNFPLVSGSMWQGGLKVAGKTSEKEESVAYIYAGPAFLATMQIPMLLGRDIEARDVTGAPKVAVVNELFVKKFLGNERPIGQRISVGGGGKNAVPDTEIVGVARTARYNTLTRDPIPVVYLPYQQAMKAINGMVFELRTAGDPYAVAGSAREIVRQADNRIPVTNVITQARQVSQTIGQNRTFAMLCSCFAALAVLIACVGLYGTMAYTVARRTSEIGIRMALGAERPNVVWMVMREVLALALAGLTIGLPVALATSKFVKTFLFGMKPTDAMAISGAALVLLVAALAAGFGPARRASRIDPMVALRQE